MQPDTSNAKQLIIERVRQATSILIAVSTDPSVDALSGALALALMLNKMDKHATAVFSGKMPPAMEFLGASKTFESTVNSLRDFIISLDKEKADRLRYKVENDVVRIFITPYKTTITEKDLQFSQGDFNVELIIALGVEKREDLDKAIVAHGRILHDATVVTINPGTQTSNLGVADWHDTAASSLCEMLLSMSESFQQPGLLDAQIATSLLTGIVAATERFSNQKTNPKVMTMAAQLMAAGANQQLIATNLGKVQTLTAPGEVAATGDLVPGAESVKVLEPEAPPAKDGELDITHKKKTPTAQPEPQTKAEEELAAALPQINAGPTFEKLKTALNEESKAEEPKIAPFLQPTKETETPGSAAVDMTAPDEDNSVTEGQPYLAGSGSWREKRLGAPELGGTLNATAEQAEEETKKSEDEDRNKMLLTHPDKPGGNTPATSLPPTLTPVNEPPAVPVVLTPGLPTEAETPAMPPLPVVEPGDTAPFPPLPPAMPPTQPTIAPAPEPIVPTPQPLAPTLTPEPPVIPTPVPPTTPPLIPEPTPIEPPALSPDLDAARQAVDAALGSQPFNPANEPMTSIGAMPLGGPLNPPVSTGPLPTISTGTTPEPLPPLPPVLPPSPLPDLGGPLPLPPSLTDVPPTPPGLVPPPPVVPPPEPTPPASNDPGQFKIPGQ